MRILDLLKAGFVKRIGNGKGTNVFSHSWCFSIPLSHKPTFIDISALHSNTMVADLLQEQSWNPSSICVWGSSEIVDRILHSLPPFIPGDDQWQWRETPVGLSLAKTSYRFLLESQLSLEDPWRGWKLLWSMHVTPKIKIFGWKLLLHRLPTTSYLHNIGLGVASPCCFCDSFSDDSTHFLFYCSSSCSIWNNLSCTYGISFRFRDTWYLGNWIFESHFNASLILTICWFIWKARNESFFEHKLPNCFEIFRLALSEFQVMQSILNSEGNGGNFDRAACHWRKPPTGTLKLNVDGSWKINSRTTGIGYLIRDHEGRCSIAVSASLEASSAMFAELYVIATALKFLNSTAMFLDTDIHIEIDCKSAIQLIEGLHQSEADHTILTQEICLLLSSLKCAIAFVPREANRAADWLARFASNTSSCNSWTNSWPNQLNCILISDVGDSFD